ncbi:MAG: SAM-dependent DNA methyltransferase [Candidatus Heimdallarchaeota archaeon]
MSNDLLRKKLVEIFGNGVLSNIDFSSITNKKDMISSIYEQITDRKLRKKFGQFFTHIELVEFIVDNIPITSKTTILDPACGAGAFLIEALKRNTGKTTNIYGIDIDSIVKSPLTIARDRLRALDFFDIDKFFLLGDQEMTDALMKICTNCEKKRCITCDESNDFYWLAARKLIHLFLYQTDLFNEIPLTADCLVKEQIDITELRHRLELQLRQTVSWELTKDEKDKFVLCTLCHLIRHFRLLGQIDLLDGIQTFFKFRGKIYGISESDLATERTELLKLLQLTKPQVLDEEPQKAVEVKQLPREEKMTHFTLPKSQRIEDLKRVFITLVESIDYESLLPITIITLRSRAKELINPEKEKLSEVEDYAWVDVLKGHWQNEELRPFLAEQALLRMDKKEESIQSPITSEKLSFDPERMPQTEKEFFQQVKRDCDNCSNDVLACGEILEQVKKTLQSGKKAIRELWQNNELLRPCIAKLLLE